MKQRDHFVLFSSPGLLHVLSSVCSVSSRKGQQRGHDAERSTVEEMEMRQCRGLGREERITERLQGQPMGVGFGRTSGAPELYGNIERRAERSSILNSLVRFREQERQK